MKCEYWRLCAQLEELSISGEENPSAWGVGIDCIPSQWCALTSLRTLQLRGHTMLSVRAPSLAPSHTGVR